jgi:TRAP-type C4-dicarboxylate transport system permease small subunit
MGVLIDTPRSKLGFFLKHWLEILTVSLLVFMVLLVGLSVTLRYVFNTGFVWSSELVAYNYFWVIFLGSVIAIKENAHIGMNIFVNRLPLKTKIVVRCFGDLLVMFFLIVLIVHSCELISKTTMFSLVMKIPMSWVYLVFPLSGILMFIEMVKVLIKHWKEER